ncbi:unnamed protein product [Caenorhabditis brenneri]
MANAFQTCAIFTILFCLTVPVVFHVRDWMAMENGAEFMGKRLADTEKSVGAVTDEVQMEELKEVIRQVERWDFWVFVAFVVFMIIFVHTALDMYYKRDIQLAKEYETKMIASKLVNV